MKVGIFGGSFDPIHCGHAMMANYLCQNTDLDEIWLMPGRLNPLKYKTSPADFDHRFEMCRIVAEKCNRVIVSDLEKYLPEPSYTYRTLCELRNSYPDHKFRLIIGSDNWMNFTKWYNPEEIIDDFGVLVYPRPGYEIDGDLPKNVCLIKNAPMAVISSTFIRDAIRNNKNMNYFIDPEVWNYIQRNQLYK